MNTLRQISYATDYYGKVGNKSTVYFSYLEAFKKGLNVSDRYSNEWFLIGKELNTQSYVPL